MTAGRSAAHVVCHLWDTRSRQSPTLHEIDDAYDAPLSISPLPSVVRSLPLSDVHAPFGLEPSRRQPGAVKPKRSSHTLASQR